MFTFQDGISLVAALRAFVRTAVLALLALPLAGCEVIGDIFQAGMWTGVIAVVVVVGLIVYAVTRLFK